MIGKTRHTLDAGESTPQSADPTAFARGCGVLRHLPSSGGYEHRRFAPPAELGGWVQHFWLETWCFATDAPQLREVLPHPSVHLVFAPGRARIYGVQLGRFVRELRGEGRVFGVKFWPGAFYPFLREPVSTIANAFVAAGCVFADVTDAAESVLGSLDERAMIAAAGALLSRHMPAPDPNVQVARRIVEEIAVDRTLTRVRQVAARTASGERTLERLFRRYVGASARWVIKRYRIYQALEQLSTDSPVHLADLAQSLGYFDQAHFANDFRRLVGRSPAEYTKQ